MFKEVRCQIETCPYGMVRTRCCFCEIELAQSDDQSTLRTKCKKDHRRMVYVKLENPGPDEAA